jgi:hypothetical protein
MLQHCDKSRSIRSDSTRDTPPTARRTAQRRWSGRVEGARRPVPIPVAAVQIPLVLSLSSNRGGLAFRWMSPTVNCRDPAVVSDRQLHPSKPTNPPAQAIVSSVPRADVQSVLGKPSSHLEPYLIHHRNRRAKAGINSIAASSGLLKVCRLGARSPPTSVAVRGLACVILCPRSVLSGTGD